MAFVSHGFTAHYSLDYDAPARSWTLSGVLRNPKSGDAIHLVLHSPHVGLLLQKYAIEAERAAVLLVAREDKCKR